MAVSFTFFGSNIVQGLVQELAKMTRRFINQVAKRVLIY
jgi:hypothetical protein